jgi:hypothetical protein
VHWPVEAESAAAKPAGAQAEAVEAQPAQAVQAETA